MGLSWFLVREEREVIHMTQAKIISAMGLVIILALVSGAQTSERREGSPPPPMVMAPQPQPLVGPGPMPPMRMRELADQLRARAREAQELSDRLRRQADELDQMAKRLMDRGPGPQQMGQRNRELDEIKEAIGRAEREGRRQEADELRRRAEQLMGRPQPMPPGPRMDEREEIKRQIERLRDEAQRAKNEGRVEDSQNLWQKAEQLEQKLREQGPREGGEFGKPVPSEVLEILRAAEQAEREGRMDDARRQREKADMVARQLQEERGNRAFGQPRPRGDERQEMKRKIEDLRNESQKAKDQGRGEDADRLWKEADRLEQQLREQGPRDKGASGRPMPPEAQGRSFKDEIIRGMDGLKKEIGRLWQTVNEMRNRPRDGGPK
jgi:hypothetical protein